MTRTWWEQSSTHPLPPTSASNGRAASAQPDSQHFTQNRRLVRSRLGRPGNWKLVMSENPETLVDNGDSSSPKIGMGVFTHGKLMENPEEMVVFVTIQRIGIKTNKHGLPSGHLT